MQFSILGPVEVIGDSGRPVELGPDDRSLLSLLLVSPNRVVPVDRLVEELWGDSLPEWARANLQMRVTRLRRALRNGGADADVIQAGEEGCLLHVPPEAIDCRVFEELVTQAGNLAAVGDHEVAADQLQRALSLWRGPAFAGIAAPPSVAIEATRLERARRAAQDALSGAGHPPAVPSAGADARLPLPARLASPPPAGFYGREPERQLLTKRLSEVAAGQRRVVFISGEPGAGKTSLAAEAARVGFGHGATVLYGRCDEKAGGGYQPMAEALRPFVIDAPDVLLRAHVERCGPDLVRLVPELARRLPALPLPIQADPGGERLRLFDSVVDLVTAATRQAPVLLVIDDLQWAAKPALLLLRHIVRSAEPMALLVLAVFRDTELGPGHAFTELLGELRREQGVERIGLGGLSQIELVALLQGFGQRDLGPARLEALARRLWAETEGNPFFVGEVVRHLAETTAGDIATWVADRGDEDMGLPDSVRDVIRGRLSRLSPAANRVLSMASVCGRDFELGVLERVPEAAEGSGAPLDGLEEAIQAHLVAEVPEAVGHYSFAHALVRQTLYGELSAARRARLHQRVGEALEAHHAQDLAEHLPTLAHHFAEAAPVAGAAKAADYALGAARRAIEGLSFEEAVAHAELGLAVLNSTEATELERRFELWMVLAQARAVVLDRPGSKAAALAAAVAARSLNSRLGLAQAARAAASALSGGMDNTPDAEVVELCEEALDRLAEEDVGPRAQLLAALAEHRALYAQAAGCEPLAREALAAARQTGDIETLCVALGALYWALEGSARAGELRAITDELHELAADDNNLVHRANGFFWRACVRITLGDRDGFDADVAALEAVAERSRSVLDAVRAALLRTSQALLDGRFDEVEPLAEKLLAVGDPAYVQAYFGELFFLRREQGRLDEYKPAFLAMVDQGLDRPVFVSALAWLHAELGELDEARSRIEQLVAEGLATVPRDNTWAVSLAIFAEVVARLEDSGTAAHLYQLLLPYQGLFIHPTGAAIMGAADRYLGMLAAATGRQREAGRHFEAALTLEHGVRSRPLLARTRYWYACSLAGGGARDRDRAPEVAGQALEAAERLGMARLAADIRAFFP